MRTALIAALLFSAIDVVAERLIVVVHTRDALVREFTCNCLDNVRSGVTRRVVSTAGYVTWHAVGGVAPYTLLDQTQNIAEGNVQVVVRDAAGTVAVGYGVVQIVRTSTSMPCPATRAKIATEAKPAAPGSQGSQGARQRFVPNGPGRTIVHHVGPSKQERDATRPQRTVVTERGGSGGGGGSPERTTIQRRTVGR